MRRDLTQAAVDQLDEDGEYTARLLTYYAIFVSALSSPSRCLPTSSS